MAAVELSNRYLWALSISLSKAFEFSMVSRYQRINEICEEGKERF